MERKLAAILAADVVGYSRLMAADEVGTLAVLKAHRKEVIDPKIAAYRGRIVKLMGDGALVEFASAVDAVQCAVDIQRALAERNTDVPDERRMDIRIGVNLGDVIVEGDDLYGEGVNVAARLQELAEAGGICLSADVHRQVEGKVDVAFDDAGAHEVKNLPRPIRMWRWREAAPAVGATSAAAKEALALPDKPSIAVLAFDNISRDPEQEYFADGITEDIITALSRFRSLFVIARNSSFAYKGRAVKVQEVGQDLGVQYVLEGSVRKAGSRVRITAQLVDAASGNHVWAERYDRDMEDIFAVQDEVTQTIVATLVGRLEAADLERAKRKARDNLAAYDYLLRGNDYHHRGTKEDNAQALRMLEKAIELDPEYAPAHAALACTIGQAWVRGYLPEPEKLSQRCFETAQKARSLDDDDSECHRILAAIHLIRGQHDQAEFHLDKALSLNPNDDRLVAQRGELLTLLGRPEEGLEWIERAARLNPYHPDGRAGDLGQALHAACRYEEAVRTFRRIAAPHHGHHAYLAACYARLGRDEEAKTHAAEVLELKPDFSVDEYLNTVPYKERSDREHHRQGLIKAGLPA